MVFDKYKLNLQQFAHSGLEPSAGSVDAMQNISPQLEPSPEREPVSLIMHHGKATDALARMSSRGVEANKITGDVVMDDGEVKVVIQKVKDLKGALGVNTHKLLSVCIASFTAANSSADHKNAQPKHYNVEIPLREYASLLGYDIEEHPMETEEEQRKEKKRAKMVMDNARKAIRRDLETLYRTGITWSEKVKGKEGDYDSVRIFGRQGIKNGTISVEFTLSMGNYLHQLPLTQYALPLLAVDPKKPNAYSMGLKLIEHANMDSNIKAGTAYRLKVTTLLAATSLPSFEAVELKDRGHWVERIKEPFESSLDELYRIGLISEWRYTAQKGTSLDDEQATPSTYGEWANLYVEFEPKDKIDHTARLAANEEKRKRRAARAMKNRKAKS